MLHLYQPAFISHRMKNHKKLNNTINTFTGLFAEERSQLKAKLIYVEHHRAHIASGFFVSPFEKAAVVSIDGFGDFASLMVGIGQGSRIKILGRVEFPHSLGLFYTAMTQFLGFWHYGDEYKVMGLSANGKPAYAPLLRKVVKLKNNGLFALNTDFFLHNSQGIRMEWDNCQPVIEKIFSPKLEKLLGPAREKGQELDQRCCDLAASVQQIYEDAFFHVLGSLYKRTGLDNLVLAGGCIQNSLANGKIYQRSDFKNIYVPASAHDGGGAIGAAYYFWNHLQGKPRTFYMESPYWGPQFESSQVIRLLEAKKIPYQDLGDNPLFLKVANDIAAGKIVGWFQGRTEWGPRALGNRSILADPRNKRMQDILNARIKRREWFRPFAPAILEEETGAWFDYTQPAPFMEKVYKIKNDRAALIPAVCHIDNTGRLQTVRQEINPRFYKLIRQFFEITQVPIILNTSFNENEPIVNTPQEALDCFLRTHMDVLVLGNIYIDAQAINKQL